MRILALPTVLILWLTGCSDRETVVEPPRVCTRSISVSPASATLHVGQTLRVSASACGMLATDFRWSSSADSVASITADGLISALRPGTAVMNGTHRTITAVVGAMALVVVP